jgi:hypothetical protein
VIRVTFDRERIDPTELAKFDDWCARAASATEEVLRKHGAGEPFTLDPAIWAEHKEWVFSNVFDEKCAYCEAKVTPQSYGDAEHFRPKGAVTVPGDNGPTTVVDARGAPHPGYFWLAYEWTNLLPACQKCNSGTKKEPGKRTQFPAKRHAFAPPKAPLDVAALDAYEEPQILNPLRGEDPAQHITFNEFGWPVSKTEIGELSIEVFGLHRGQLNTDRHELFTELHDVVRDAIGKEYLGGARAQDALRDRMGARRKPYLAATREYIRYWWPIVRAEGSERP